MSHLKDLQEWSKTTTKYPKFSKALREFEDIIGLNDAKEHFYKKLKYAILLHIGIEPSRNFKTRSMTKKVKAQHPNRSRKKSRKTSKNDLDTKELKHFIKEMLVKQLQQSIVDKYASLDDDDDSDYNSEDDGCVSAASDDEEEEDDYEIAEPRASSFVKKHDINLHLMLLGPSGVGKTFMARKIYNLYAALELVEPDCFKVATRSDFVGMFQGHTSDKTKSLINEYTNGVIFIDEAYSLVQSGSDCFGNEALVEIIEAMTNDEINVTFFFAGYTKSVMKTLFSANEGLERRIATVLELTKPNSHDLFEIFIQNVKKRENKKLSIKKSAYPQIEEIFRKNRNLFKNNGGDVIIFIDFVKTELIDRLWCSNTNKKFTITGPDVEKAIRSMNKMRRTTNSKPSHLNAMYI